MTIIGKDGKEYLFEENSYVMDREEFFDANEDADEEDYQEYVNTKYYEIRNPETNELVLIGTARECFEFFIAG